MFLFRRVVMGCRLTPIRRILCVTFGVISVYSLFSFIAFTREYSDPAASHAMNKLCPKSVVESRTHAQPAAAIPISRHRSVTTPVLESDDRDVPKSIPWHDRVWHAVICPLHEQTGRWATVFLVLSVIAGVLCGWLYRGLFLEFQHFKHNYPGLNDEAIPARASSAVAAVAEPVPPPPEQNNSPTNDSTTGTATSGTPLSPKTVRWWLHGFRRILFFVFQCLMWCLVQAWSDDGLLSRLFVVSYHSIDCGVSTARCLYCPIRCGSNLWLLIKRYSAQCKSTYQSVRRLVRRCLGYKHEADYSGIGGGAVGVPLTSSTSTSSHHNHNHIVLTPLPDVDDSISSSSSSPITVVSTVPVPVVGKQS